MWLNPNSFLTVLQTSKPFFLGIITSRKTRFGCSSRIVSRAASPLLAVKSSTPSSSRSSRDCWISVRKCGSSSTIRIFMVSCVVLIASCLLINKKENVLHSLLETQRAHRVVTGEKRIQDDDVRLRQHGSRNQLSAVRLHHLVAARLQNIGKGTDGGGVLIDHHHFLPRLALIK